MGDMSDQPQPPRSDHQWLGDSDVPSGPPPGQYPAPNWGPPPNWGTPTTDAFGRPVAAPAGSYPPGMVPAPQAPSSATWALVLGIVGFVLCPLLASIPAWIIGAQARQEAGRLPGQPGHGMATAGMVLGIIATVIWSLLLLLFLIGVAMELDEFETASVLLGNVLA